MEASLSTGSERPRPFRNPGPTWGFRALHFGRAVIPAVVVRILLAIGAAVAVALMKRARAHSRAYLRIVLGREPGWRDVWRHFHTFSHYLLDRLSIWEGDVRRKFRLFGTDPKDPRFIRMVLTGRPFIAGAFHVGHSELLGFLLSPRHGRLSMVRLRVGNTEDTDRMVAHCAPWLETLWINDPGDLIFALKDAMERERAVVLLCDRPAYSSKKRVFRFLGARRWFPFTQYHLGILYDVPVVLTFALPDEHEEGKLTITASPVFHPPKDLPKTEKLDRAHAHFQEFLDRLEETLRRRPYHWFNFEPLNPVASDAGTPAARPPATPRETDWSHETPLSVPDDAPYFQAHFPGNPIVPGAVLLGWMVEAVRDRTENPDGEIRAVNVKFLREVRPGARLLLRCRRARDTWETELASEGRPVAKARFKTR